MHLNLSIFFIIVQVYDKRVEFPQKKFVYSIILQIRNTILHIIESLEWLCSLIDELM